MHTHIVPQLYINNANDGDDLKSNRVITLYLLILMEMKRKLVTLDKVFVQTSLKRNILISSYIFLLNVNFENLTGGLHVLHVLNMHVKFHSN